jgi:hypothetical protein
VTGVHGRVAQVSGFETLGMQVECEPDTLWTLTMRSNAMRGSTW